jgi:small subunit ribosomal protein S6
MFILDSHRYARDAARVSRQVEELIESAGGTLMVSRLWEERRLAYPLKGQRKGAYWLTYFRMDGGKLASLNRQCQINDVILRHLVLRVDPRIVDALISHITADTKEETKEATETSEAAEAPVTAAAETDKEQGDPPP